MADELWQRSAGELAAGIDRRQFSCREVMDAVVRRIRAKNGALNAIVYDYTEEALAEARRADEELAAGMMRGPLHGIPVTIKENVDQRGTPTPNGLPAFAGLIASDDAPVVRNLRRAGAIIVGRTNTPELSMRATTDNPLHGRTRNPWHPDASPGGSSGGAGAAAAAGFGPIHHGNDIGGSLRFPAFACGLSTVKPTPGRIPAYNPSATAERGLLAQLMSVQGAICREVKDVRLATRVMAGRDARDPWWVPTPFDGEPVPAPIRVAFTRNPHGYPMHADITRAVERVAGWLAGAGYAVEEIEPPPITEPARAWFSVAVAEMKVMLFPLARQHGSRTIQDIFDGIDVTLHAGMGTMVNDKHLVESIAESWGKVGIRAKIQMMEMGARQRMLNDRGLPANGLLLVNPQSTLLDADGALWRIWHPNGFNGKYWSGSQPGQRFHDLMEQARYTLDAKKRKDLYTEATQIIHDEKPWLELFQEVIVYGTTRRVTFRPRPDFRLIVAEMTLAR